jgi:hypothetical protein
MDIEGPAIAGVYQLLGQRDQLHYTLFDFPHNYNQTTREALYRWAGQTLLHQSALEASALKEAPYQKEPDNALQVWNGHPRPDDAVDAPTLISRWIEEMAAQMKDLRPHDPDSATRFKAIMTPLWRHTLQVEYPVRNLAIVPGALQTTSHYSAKTILGGRPGQGDRLPMLLLEPLRQQRDILVVLAHPQGRAAHVAGPDQHPIGLALNLLESGASVMLLDTFLTGDLANAEASNQRRHLDNYFHVYNRTDLQERVQDLITACALARRQQPHAKVVLCGQDQAGLWALLAAPAADAVCADAQAVDLSADEALLTKELFSPGLRRLGAFAGAAALAAPHPLLVHHLGPGFDRELLEAAYRHTPAPGQRAGLRLEPAPLEPADVAAWIRELD